MKTYPVSEIYSSIQGEGRFTGQLALFIRFQFCHLTCKWCDTKYTWLEKSGFFSWMSLAEILDKIKNFEGNLIVLTGGEPLWQDIEPIISAFSQRKNFQVETSGYLWPDKEETHQQADGYQLVKKAMRQEVIEQVQWVVSPKMDHSGMPALKKELYQYWNSLKQQIFKIVIRDEMELLKIDQLVKENNLDKTKVYLSLEGKTRESQLRPELVDKIINAGYNFSARIHILLWGDERGR